MLRGERQQHMTAKAMQQAPRNEDVIESALSQSSGRSIVAVYCTTASSMTKCTAASRLAEGTGLTPLCLIADSVHL